MRIWASRRADLNARLAGAALGLCALLAPASVARAASAADVALASEVVRSAHASVNLELDVRLNGHPRNLIASFRGGPDGQVIGAAKAELVAIGFDPRRLQEASDGLVHLSDVPGLKVRYDEAEQVIELTAEPSLLATTRVDARGSDEKVAVSPTPLGGVLNYTVFGTAGQVGKRVGWQGATVELEGRVFGRFGVVSSTAVASSGTGAGNGVVRLDTTWRYDRPDTLISYAAGDVITHGLTWTRPVRLGGLQVSRSFELRPDLVTTPVPVIRGSAAAPSTLDLYVNNVRQYSAEVPAGPFEISRAPLAYGAGMAEVVVRDALGRDTRIDLPFYASESLLAPGLFDFALEAGYARRSFGSLSNDYDRRLAASGSLRYGLNGKLTLEAHGEAAGGLVNGGVGAVVGVGRWAVLSAAASGSRAGGDLGGLFDVGLEARHRSISLALHVQRTVGGYQDLASWTSARGPPIRDGTGLVITDPSDPLYQAAFRAPSAIDQAVLSVPLWTQRARLNLSYARLVRDDDRARLVGVSMSYDLGRANLYVRALHDFEHKRSTVVSIGLSMPLGRGTFATAEARGDASGASVVAEAASRGVEKPGDLGWRVRLGEGATSDRLVSGALMTSYGRLEAGLQQLNGRSSGYGQASGGLAWVAGRPFVSPRLDGAFAIVDAGVKGLPVRFENRPIGTTGAGGKLLVPNLVAYRPNRIAIDPTSLPPDMDFVTDQAAVAPRGRSAALVRLGVQESAAALLTLVDGDGRALETGSEGRLEGAAGESFFVGYDGETFVTGLSPRNRIVVTRPGGRTCHTEFAFKPQRGRQVRLGVTPCLPASMIASTPGKLAAN